MNTPSAQSHGRRGATLRNVLVGLPFLIALSGLALPAAGQSGSGDVAGDHSPHGALWRAAAVPGWGQLYNRQYYKIPVVWAGLGGLTATALYVNQRYLRFRHAYHFVEGTNTSERNLQDYLLLLREETSLTPEEAESRQGELSAFFERNRDALRRNRDLLYIGIGLFYGLSILDAYVNAHLLDFDVGEDLTLSIEAAPRGLAASIRLRQ